MKNSLWGLVIWLTVAGGSVWANDSSEWNEGKLTLRDGTELKGELCFNWKAPVIQYRRGDVIKAYSACQTRSFVHYDTQQQSIRKFVSSITG